MALNAMWEAEIVTGSDCFFTEASFDKFSILGMLDHIPESNGVKSSLVNVVLETTTGNKRRSSNSEESAPAESVKSKGKKQKLSYPRLSFLTKEEQKLYLQLYFKFLHHIPSKPTAAVVKEINSFKELQMKVGQEQEEFMGYLEKRAHLNADDYQYIHDQARLFVEVYTKTRCQCVTNYPQFYNFVDSIALSGHDLGAEIPVMTLERLLLSVGQVPTINLPQVDDTRKPKIPVDCECTRKAVLPDGSTNKVCSSDGNAMKLAAKYNVDIVVSSDAFSSLVDSGDWQIPICVTKLDTSVTGSGAKNVIFMDAPLPATKLSARKQNLLYHESAFKTLFRRKLYSANNTTLSSMDNVVEKRRTDFLDQGNAKLASESNPTLITNKDRGRSDPGIKSDTRRNSNDASAQSEIVKCPDTCNTGAGDVKQDDRKKQHVQPQDPIRLQPEESSGMPGPAKGLLQPMKGVSKSVKDVVKDSASGIECHGKDTSCDEDALVIDYKSPPHHVVDTSSQDESSTPKCNSKRVDTSSQDESSTPQCSSQGVGISTPDESSASTSYDVITNKRESDLQNKGEPKKIKMGNSDPSSPVRRMTRSQAKTTVLSSDEVKPKKNRVRKRYLSKKATAQIGEMEQETVEISSPEGSIKDDKQSPTSPNKNCQGKLESIMSPDWKKNCNDIPSLRRKPVVIPFDSGSDGETLKDIQQPAVEGGGEPCSSRSMTRTNGGESTLSHVGGAVFSPDGGANLFPQDGGAGLSQDGGANVSSQDGDAGLLSQTGGANLLTRDGGAVLSPIPSSVGTLDGILKAQSKMLESGPKVKATGSSASIQGPGDGYKGCENPSKYSQQGTDNFTYTLWRFGEMKILSRTSFDGVIQDQLDQKAKSVMLSTKLEYQSTFGYEQVLPSETAKMWSTSFLRNNCNVVRARINPFSSELLMVEELTTAHILYPRCPFNPTTAMRQVYAVFEGLTKLDRGDYLLSHASGDVHCHIRKAIPGKQRGCYDLHAAYLNPDTKVKKSPLEWIPIDPNILLSSHKTLNRIPATFEPRGPSKEVITSFHRKKGKKKKKQSLGKRKVPPP